MEPEQPAADMKASLAKALINDWNLPSRNTL